MKSAVLKTIIFSFVLFLWSFSASAYSLEPDTLAGGNAVKDSVICVKVNLVPSVELTSTPEGAEISLDGKKCGLTPLFIDSVSIGRHQLHLSKEGYDAVRMELDIRDSVLYKFHAYLPVREDTYEDAYKAYRAQDFAKAIKIAKELDEKKNDMEAQNMLGACYEYGNGVEPSVEEAFKWYSKAAAQGHPAAQCTLGFFYDDGIGVERSPKDAVAWFSKAAEQGYVVAVYNLGCCYYIGKGVARSCEKAVELFREAAEAGYVASQNDLGNCYRLGNGVQQSYDEALLWYTKAAEQGYYPAQHNMGVCYENGYGVEPSKEEAIKWYKLAAEQGDEYAREALERMTSVEE